MGIVAIVGRPNVGKSTLFNRLVGMRQAIVDSTAGTTRDRHYGRTDWNGREFSVIDTGGYTVNGEDVFEEEIRRQVMLAIDEADVILFMTEVSTGITDLDMFMADILRRADKKVFLVVNKVDNSEQLYGTPEFYALGLGEPYAISSMSGSGTGDLMDAIVAALPPDERDGGEEELPRITIVGRPNVGKSSMTNALLGQERSIVTPVAGTTRDSIHTRYNKYGMDFYLIDTAGLRKKGKVTEDLEFYSVMRSIRAIESSDVCILMLDASQGVESQDLNIFNLIVRNRKGCVIVVNKWDLISKDSNAMKEWRAAIAKKLAPFSDVPVIFTSVPDRQRILEVLQTAAGLSVACAADSDFGVQRLHPADNRRDTAALDKRKIHPYQICGPASQPYARVRLFRQSAAVYKGYVQAFSRKQDTRALGFLGSTHSDIFQTEVTVGFPPPAEALPGRGVHGRFKRFVTCHTNNGARLRCPSPC